MKLSMARLRNGRFALLTILLVSTATLAPRAARAEDAVVPAQTEASAQERSLGWLVGGVGLATIGASGLLLASAGSTDSASARDFDRGCAIAGLGIGAVVSGLGAWLAITADRRVRVVPTQDAHGGGFRVVTVW
jgi:uncharacterized membrane protein YidH (DUF202 family)